MNIPLNLSDDEIIRIMREHFEGLFPRVCPNCNRRYATLREYILSTKRIGATISYDAEIGDWETMQPIGAFALANCTCGSTIALSTDGIPISQMQLLLKWVKTETERRGLRPRELIDYVRDEVRKQVLADPVKDTHKD